MQLKIPFSKAFSRKKLKLSSVSDVDSDTASLYSDASLAQSAQAQLSGTRSVPTTPIKCSRSDVMYVSSMKLFFGNYRTTVLASESQGAGVNGTTPLLSGVWWWMKKRFHCVFPPVLDGWVTGKTPSL